MRETALGFRRRAERLEELAGPRADWATRGCMDVAYALEAIGADPEGYARVLALADQIQPRAYVPAGLTDIAPGYRIGVAEEPGRSSGEPLGCYRGAVIVAWAISRG